MTSFIQFAILGISTGSLYVLGALGLVLVKRSSGVINFAHGAFGMAATFLFWELRDRHGMPFATAFIISVLFAAALGALTYQFVMRRLRRQSLLAQLVVTLAVLVILQAVVALRYSGESYVVAPILPHGAISMGGISVDKDRLIIFAGVLLLIVALSVFYRRTKFGRLTSAVADNAEALAGLGVAPDRVQLINWTLGSGLAGVAWIFLAPIQGLAIDSATALLVPMLAAAVVGEFKSFTLTLVGGLVIGVAQSLVVQHSSTPGLVSVVPAVVAVVVLIARGRATPARGDSTIRMPSIGSGRIRPLWLIVFTAGLIVLAFEVPLNWLDAISLQVAIAMILLSLVVVVGYCGQLSLTQVGFAGIGGWLSGTLATNHGWPLLPAIIVSVLASVLLAVIAAAAAARTRGLNLAVVTIAIAVALDAMIFNNTAAQGSIQGISTPKLSLFGWSFDYFTFPRRYTSVAIVVLILFVVAVANMRRSRVGRRLIAVRVNERAAASLGISVLGSKVFAFATGAALAAVGGVFLAYTQFSLTFTNGQYNVFTSITALQESVVGGVGWASGAPAGSLLQQGGVGSLVLDSFGDSVDKYIFLIGGVLLLVTILQGPDGIVPNVVKQVRGLSGLVRPVATRITTAKTRFKPAKARDADVDALLEATTETGRVRPLSLRLERVSVRYGAVVAVSDLSLEILPGRVTGLIGPNGAGKTSVLDAITGFTRANTGSIHLGDRDLARTAPHERARAGLGRSFQSMELFGDMTVRENMLAASERRDWTGYLSSFAWPGKPALTDTGVAAVREFGLDRDLDRLPGELPHGRQRMLAIARAVAAEPSVLLLDEPAAGLDEVESAELAHLIRRLASDWGIAVLLIEHDIPLVLSTCDYIYTIDFGKLIAEGHPDEIRTNAEVRRAYLGVDVESSPL